MTVEKKESITMSGQNYEVGTAFVRENENESPLHDLYNGGHNPPNGTRMRWTIKAEFNGTAFSRGCQTFTAAEIIGAQGSILPPEDESHQAVVTVVGAYNHGYAYNQGYFTFGEGRRISFGDLVGHYWKAEVVEAPEIETPDDILEVRTVPGLYMCTEGHDHFYVVRPDGDVGTLRLRDGHGNSSREAVNCLMSRGANMSWIATPTHGLADDVTIRLTRRAYDHLYANSGGVHLV